MLTVSDLPAFLSTAVEQPSFLAKLTVRLSLVLMVYWMLSEKLICNVRPVAVV